jgi:hypothetical protein
LKKIREYVEVLPQPTVVRLDHLQDPESNWISDSFYLTDEIQTHLQSLHALFTKASGCGIFLIGHYGCGKSHFLAYLTQQLQTGRLCARNPVVAPVSLVNYRATESLESILDRQLGLGGAQRDRREAWSAVGTRFSDGLVILFDELSEFLRSKPTPQDFSEDLRFLQFLGEWAQGHALWVVAALQEQIEHTGEIEYDLFRKIKDRFPVRLLLTPGHVRDLIARRILRKKPEYAAAVEALAREIKEAYPQSVTDGELLRDIYPLHPSTLELLEEVRDRFSQARGVIDFTLTQLLGSEARGVPPFLDNPWGHLLTPDTIIDHFSDLFEVQPEFLAIAQKVLPYYRRHMPELFETAPQQQLAWRLVKLLILANLSPRRNGLTAEEAAFWLSLKVARVDPSLNREVIKRTLDTLCRQGAFARREGATYVLDLKDDSKRYLDQLLVKATEELKSRPDYSFELLFPCLHDADFNPFEMPRDRWHMRRIRWHFHEWELQVYFGGGQPPEPKRPALQVGLPWGTRPTGRGCYTLSPTQLQMTPEVLELAALKYLSEKPLPSAVLARINERIAARASWFASLVRAAYQEAVVLDPESRNTRPPLIPLKGGLVGWINAYGEWILRLTYPQFEQFAPLYGPLPREAHRQFMKFASESDLGVEQAPEYVKLIREAYLLPMGLMQRRGPEYAVVAKLENHELVRLLAPVLQHHPSPARIYEHLSAPVYGLVPDQTQLLLSMLLIQGEIDIVKEDRSYRDLYETLPNPLHYDRILPGQALSTNELRDLQTLCEGFHLPVPKQWSVLAQKRAIEQLRRLGSRHRDRLSEFVTRLKSSGEAADLTQPFENVIGQWLTLEKGDNELQGFQHFMFAVGNARRFVSEANELASLPARYEQLLRETQRFRHLLGYPVFSNCTEPGVAAQVQALGTAPALERAAELEEWLGRAQDAYRMYIDWYRGRHEHWRHEVDQHPIWTYRVPTAARSSHFAGGEPARDIEALLAEARSSRCCGLAALDFQPLCRCGFDGKKAPLDETLARFDSAADALQKDLGLFFQQDKVRSKMRDWLEKKIEIKERTLQYLEGKAAYPDVDSIELLDQHLSGLDLVHNLTSEELLGAIGDQVWQKQELMKALDRLFDRYGPRIKLTLPESAPRKQLATWCCEQALRHGSSLPAGLSFTELAMMPSLIQPEWVGEAALSRLDQLGFGETAILRVLELLLSGAVRPADPVNSSGAVAVAFDLLSTRRPSTPEELSRQAIRMYSEHERFVRLRPHEWLSRLEDLAARDLPSVPKLEAILQPRLNCQWVVVDCLGVLLLDSVKQVLPACFPARKLDAVEYGLTSEASSTASFYAGLAKSDFRQPFFKINVVDDLIHSRKLRFQDLAALARAELEIALKKVAQQLDPARRLVLFGDHGFRRALDGGSFCHGGASMLERLVPVFQLSPASS